MRNLKKAWKSLTIWFNSVIAAIFSLGDVIKENIPFAQQYLTPETVKYAVIAVVFINIGLRFKTNKALGDK